MTETSTETARVARIDRETATRLAAEEYGRYTELLRSLTAEEWACPTDCSAWDVFAMAGHCLGLAEYAASPEEAGRQQAAAAAAGGVFIDALTALQVAEHAHLTPAELVASYAGTTPQAAAGRAHIPDEMRAITLSFAVNGELETWTLGFLADVILTRDVWMHRVDTSRATGRQIGLTPEHDGVLVADIVAEWAERHGRPYDLTLTGPAGGHWSSGSGGPAYELDAVEFCRILSGRAQGDGLLTTGVPF